MDEWICQKRSINIIILSRYGPSSAAIAICQYNNAIMQVMQMMQAQFVFCLHFIPTKQATSTFKGGRSGLRTQVEASISYVYNIFSFFKSFVPFVFLHFHFHVHFSFHVRLTLSDENAITSFGSYMTYDSSNNRPAFGFSATTKDRLSVFQLSGTLAASITFFEIEAY